MKKFRPFLVSLLLVIVLWTLPVAGQSLDPSFAASSTYAPGVVTSVVEQPDGKLVVSGRFSRVNGTAADVLTRFNADGTVDAAFQQKLGVSLGGAIYQVRLLSNGQLLLNASNSPRTIGGITRKGLLRLNADGTGDATFGNGTGPSSSILDFVPLPSGQVIAGGFFTSFNGSNAPHIVRLTATGAVDPAFNPGQGPTIPNSGIPPYIGKIVALPNGQLLVGGTFSSYNGNPCNGLARLNADGSFDPTFVQGLGANSRVEGIIVQPDGRILLAGKLLRTTTSGQGFARLLPTGAYDSNFTPPTTAVATDGDGFANGQLFDPLRLQPDGKILVANPDALAGTPPTLPRLARLNADGTLDPTFQIGAGPSRTPNTLTLLANGKLLTGGDFEEFSGVYDRPLVQLTTTGALDSSFQPLIQALGSITAIVRQADGKLVVGGFFSEINGQAMRRLGRVNANGTPDATFTAAVGAHETIRGLALQPDGSLIVGTFHSVRRLLPTGLPDNTFRAPDFTISSIIRLLLQPDGRILLGGHSLPGNGNAFSASIIRLLPDGSRDASFAPTSLGAGPIEQVEVMELQPNGKLVVAGFYYADNKYYNIVKRFENTGAPDVSFKESVVTADSYVMLAALRVQPDEKILLGGQFAEYSGTARRNLARLNADGTLDAGFVPPSGTGVINTLLLQPNGRIVLGGSSNGTSAQVSLARLLPDGQADPSFDISVAPTGYVSALLLQPDGALVAGGYFTTFAGQPRISLARITAPSVLHVAAPRAVAKHTTAWPVPARTNLYVAPDASAHPLSLDLLDALGRSVRHQALGNAITSLPVGNLPAGTYLLRVTYAEGTIVRRIQIE